MNLPEIQTLAAKYGVSGAQVLIRFLTRQQIVTIPMSLNAARIASNFDTFGFKRTNDEMADLRQFDQHHGINGWPTTMHEDQY
jgi:diketogulonate reductase-like aldo/keto reductase